MNKLSSKSGYSATAVVTAAISLSGAFFNGNARAEGETDGNVRIAELLGNIERNRNAAIDEVSRIETGLESHSERLDAVDTAFEQLSVSNRAFVEAISGQRAEVLIADIYRGIKQAQHNYIGKAVENYRFERPLHLNPQQIEFEVAVDGVLIGLQEHPNLQAIFVKAMLSVEGIPPKEAETFLAKHLEVPSNGQVRLALASRGKFVKELYDVYKKYKGGKAAEEIAEDKFKETMLDNVLESAFLSVAEFMCLQEAILDAGVGIGSTLAVSAVLPFAPLTPRQRSQVLQQLISQSQQEWNDLGKAVLQECRKGGALTKSSEWISEQIIEAVQDVIQREPLENDDPAGYRHGEEAGDRFFDRPEKSEPDKNEPDKSTPKDPPRKEPPRKEPVRPEPRTVPRDLPVG